MRTAGHQLFSAFALAFTVAACSSSGSDLFNPTGAAGSDASSNSDGNTPDSACPGACLPGSAECVGDSVRTCELKSGCGSWGAANPCPATKPYCSAGKCSETCLDECKKNGARRCKGSKVQVCGQYDTDKCLEWGAETSCPSGTECSGDSGECVAKCTGPGCDAGTDSAPDVVVTVDAKQDSTCYPNCTAQPCGANDGCGGVCSAGTCGYGLNCQSGTCVCDSSSCWGCCSKGQCQLGTSPSACGGGGTQCVECASGETCTNQGQCKCEPECWNKACNSSDGCGGVCTDGDCGSGYYCASEGCKPCLAHGGNCQGDPGHCCSFTCGLNDNICN